MFLNPYDYLPLPLVSFTELSFSGALAACFILACVFVFSLYAVDLGLPRNHPETVKRRLAVIIIVCILAPVYLWLWSDRHYRGGTPISAVVGLRWNGRISAMVGSLLLVVVLYAGPIIQAATSGQRLFENIKRERFDINLRNYVVAPFAEEFIFRGCMIPLLLPHLGPLWTILLCPLFFGLAHVHHLVEWVRGGRGTLLAACTTVIVQVCYTSIFGMFSAFLFIRTGHLVSAVASHTFCNMMGLPDVEGVPHHQFPVLIWLCYIAGLAGFVVLLFPLTNPGLLRMVGF